MKKMCKRIGAIFTVLALVLSFAGCKEAPKAPATQSGGATQPPPPPTEDRLQQELTDKYEAAIAALTKAPVGMEVEASRDLTIAGQHYSEKEEVTLNCWNLGTEEFLAMAEREVTFGDKDYDADIEEIFSGGKLYQKLKKDKFYAEVSAEEFLARYAPVKMFDPALYTLSVNEAGNGITFADGIAGEAWLVPENATVTAASGTAEMNDQGALSKSTYTVTYQCGAAEVTYAYQVEFVDVDSEPTVPEDTADYSLIDHPDAVYVLEHTYGYLAQAKRVTMNVSNLLMSAAAGVVIQSSDEVNVYSTDDDYAAKWTVNATVNDYFGDQDSSGEITQVFKDGKYTITIDGEEETTVKAVKQKDMEATISDYLVTYLMEKDAFASTKTTNFGDLLLFEYTGTEDVGEEFCTEVSINLFQNPNLLDEHASSYKTNKMEFYVALDAYTSLPVSAGVAYEGAHTIEKEEYILCMQVDKSFDLASITSYKEIFEEFEPEAEPETPATPLFYRVTGADGQQMWLLGTIHVGDNRTAYLPKEIYEALETSDALALECDTKAFEEQIEDDEKLQEEIGNCYYYSDGTMLKDHLVTPELYETTMQMMKATGNYNPNFDYAKPFILGGSVEQFQLRQGYALISEKGVEDRLTKIAEEKKIPIWEVESVIFQTQMMSNYSDNLQEFMLYGTIATDYMNYVEQVAELYELWCAGDETALKEKIKNEAWVIREEDINLENLTEEELERAKKTIADLDNINKQLVKLNEEYNKAMSVDRNEGMLEVAKKYLESGDTVFYAVGLAHLLAENGLVNTLRDAGYTVELVSYS